MRFKGSDSHVRRLTKADLAPKKEGGLYTVAEKRKQKITPGREQYVVTKDYTDPFTGEKHSKGDVLANRQGRNVQAQEQGNYSSYSQYQRVWGKSAKLSNPQVRNRNAWIRKASASSGRSNEAIRNDPDVQRGWTELYQIHGGKKDKRAHGYFATFLEDLGLREEGADYDVGDTPGEE
jgi:hypothetical protein